MRESGHPCDFLGLKVAEGSYTDIDLVAAPTMVYVISVILI